MFSPEILTNVLTYGVAVVSGVVTSVALWRMFRPKNTIKVTRKDTGKSVVLNKRADWQEGNKLLELMK
jgi:hypothetical protein